MEVVYLDASAILKLVVEEPESSALLAWLSDWRARATSIVGVVETRRNARKRGADLAEQVAFVLGGIDVIDLDDRVADLATALPPVELRSLDAVHLASAQVIGRDLAMIVTYDRRMIEAARAAGLPVVSPGREGTG